MKRIIIFLIAFLPLFGQVYAGEATLVITDYKVDQQGNLFRIGISGKIVHRLTQNLFHKIISFPAYDNYANTINNSYSYYGRHNPISIW